MKLGYLLASAQKVLSIYQDKEPTTHGEIASVSLASSVLEHLSDNPEINADDRVLIRISSAVSSQT